MKKIFDWTFGIIALVLGVAEAVWIAYNLFVEAQPETHGLSVLPALSFTALLLWVGAGRIRKALRKEEPAPTEPEPW